MGKGDIIINSYNKEQIESAIELLIIRLNELNTTPNKKYFLGTLRDKGRTPFKLNLD